LAEPARDAHQDELYEQAAAVFGAGLERLARAYEADPHRRQDLLQDIHLAVWRSLGLYSERCSLRTWVYRVAHNIATSHMIRQQRIYRGLVTLEEVEQTGTCPEDEFGLDRALTKEKLLLLIQRLKPVDRQVIHSYLEGMDAASIGEITGISGANVATKVRRIKSILARRFQKGGNHGR
jgi:RNA polymerase sigma-70 factor, ECF subfamily